MKWSAAVVMACSPSTCRKVSSNWPVGEETKMERKAVLEWFHPSKRTPPPPHFVVPLSTTEPSIFRLLSLSTPPPPPGGKKGHWLATGEGRTVRLQVRFGRDFAYNVLYRTRKLCYQVGGAVCICHKLLLQSVDGGSFLSFVFHQLPR
jgi:hypothetical protein